MRLGSAYCRYALSPAAPDPAVPPRPPGLTSDLSPHRGLGCDHWITRLTLAMVHQTCSALLWGVWDCIFLVVRTKPLIVMPSPTSLQPTPAAPMPVAFRGHKNDAQVSYSPEIPPAAWIPRVTPMPNAKLMLTYCPNSPFPNTTCAAEDKPKT